VIVETLTGRRRHRLGWLGRLVLQVEVEIRTEMIDPHFIDIHVVTSREWRDARTSDLTEERA
jgi:hypothetical protein